MGGQRGRWGGGRDYNQRTTYLSPPLRQRSRSISKIPYSASPNLLSIPPLPAFNFNALWTTNLWQSKLIFYYRWFPKPPLVRIQTSRTYRQMPYVRCNAKYGGPNAPGLLQTLQRCNSAACLRWAEDVYLVSVYTYVCTDILSRKLKLPMILCWSR